MSDKSDVCPHLGGRMTARRLRWIIRGLNGRRSIMKVVVGKKASQLWAIQLPYQWEDGGVVWEYNSEFFNVIIHFSNHNRLFIRPQSIGDLFKVRWICS